MAGTSSIPGRAHLPLLARAAAAATLTVILDGRCGLPRPQNEEGAPVHGEALVTNCASAGRSSSTAAEPGWAVTPLPAGCGSLPKQRASGLPGMAGPDRRICVSAEEEPEPLAVAQNCCYIVAMDRTIQALAGAPGGYGRSATGPPRRTLTMIYVLMRSTVAITAWQRMSRARSSGGADSSSIVSALTSSFQVATPLAVASAPTVSADTNWYARRA